jgi:predicted peptidase
LIFLKKLIEKIGQEYNIDKTRIIASGHSRGASMAIIAAFELPDLIAGACPQSGFTEFQYHKRIQAWNGRKIPFVFIHGVLDTDIAITRTGTVEASDSLVKILRDKGWTDNELYYYRLENVAHRWQPQLNQQWWDFLLARPLTK